MIKICFVCLGNICRSPMAEFIMKDKIKKNNLQAKFFIESKGTSYEEEGNDTYPNVKRLLEEKGISYTKRCATTLVKSDYEKYDYFIGMDQNNIRNMKYLFNNDPNSKVYKLLDFTELKKDVEDPWYTRNFEKVYQEIEIGCDELIKYLIKNID